MFSGATNTSTGVTSFLGIPYAAPPTGEIRNYNSIDI
jgi:carboxylesterase type B